ERAHQGLSYYVGTTPGQQVAAVCFASPLVVIVGREPGVHRAMDLLSAPVPQGPLAGAIELARGKSQGAFGAHPAAGGTKRLRQHHQRAFLADVKTARGTLDLAEKSSLDVRLEMPDEARAKKLRSTISTTLFGVRLILALAKANPKADPNQVKGAEMAQKLLN